MPLDLIAHGVVLAAGVKAAPLVFAKASGAAQTAMATKGGLFAAAKAKLGGCAFSGKGKIAKDLQKLENDIENMDKDMLMMPFALASPMALFGGKTKEIKTADNPRQVRRTRKTDRREAYGSFL